MRKLSLPRSNSGFTLVELLVVIAIIGILVGLLLPAVQAARESARRAQCTNNVKNIALAIHNYHDTNGALPPGHDFDTWRRAAWGWGFHILPFIEESALHDALSSGAGQSRRTLDEVFSDIAGDPTHPDVAQLQRRIDLYRCPSDNTPDIVPLTEGGVVIREWIAVNAPADFAPATANYVGSKGFFTDRNCIVGTKLGCDDTGVFFIGSKVRLNQITDGTSKTFMIGERDQRCDSGAWIGTPNPPSINRDHNYWVTATTFTPLNRPELSPKGNFWACERAFGSTHPGGANFAMCDASVQFINDEIDSDTGNVDHRYRPTAAMDYPANWPNEDIGLYQRLGSREDGLVAAGR